RRTVTTRRGGLTHRRAADPGGDREGADGRAVSCRSRALTPERQGPGRRRDTFRPERRTLHARSFGRSADGGGLISGSRGDRTDGERAVVRRDAAGSDRDRVEVRSLSQVAGGNAAGARGDG